MAWDTNTLNASQQGLFRIPALMIRVSFTNWSVQNNPWKSDRDQGQHLEAVTQQDLVCRGHNMVNELNKINQWYDQKIVCFEWWSSRNRTPLITCSFNLICCELHVTMRRAPAEELFTSHGGFHNSKFTYSPSTERQNESACNTVRQTAARTVTPTHKHPLTSMHLTLPGCRDKHFSYLAFVLFVAALRGFLFFHRPDLPITKLELSTRWTSSVHYRHYYYYTPTTVCDVFLRRPDQAVGRPARSWQGKASAVCVSLLSKPLAECFQSSKAVLQFCCWSVQAGGRGVSPQNLTASERPLLSWCWANSDVRDDGTFLQHL